MPKPKQPTIKAMRADLVRRIKPIANPEQILALQIDRNLEGRIWAGTTLNDRTRRAGGTLSRDLLGQVERSLFNQESYEEFEGRMLKHLGISTETPSGTLAKLEQQLYMEAKLGWNTAMASKNVQVGTVPIWRVYAFDDSLTPGCLRNHGKIVTTQLRGRTPPRHWGCRCDTIQVPDPTSLDAKWAALGRETIDAMIEERESFTPVAIEPSAKRLHSSHQEAVRERRESKFASFREAWPASP